MNEQAHLELQHAVETKMPVFHAAAFRYLRNREDAEDAVQDALLLAHSRLHQFRGEAKLTTWVFKIIQNVVRMRKRDSKESLMVGADGEWFESMPADVLTPEDMVLAKLERERLHAAARNLTPVLRQTFALRMAGYSIEEIAELVRAPAGTVKARISRYTARVTQTIRKGKRLA